jgi:mRNA interferase YafQ
MLTIRFTNGFKRSYKKCIRRGLDATVIEQAIQLLAETGTLPDSYNPHKLKGQFKDCWECHLQPDWLLVWQQDNERLVLILIDTGTHSDIFGR